MTKFRPEKEPPYYWEEVENALAGMHSMAKPKRVAPADLKKVDCPQCGEPMTALYWANSDRNWKALCGVAGWIRYCRQCKEWTKILPGEVWES